MPNATWIDVGGVDDLTHQPVQQVLIGRTPVALTYRNEQFGAINGACNHVGGFIITGGQDNIQAVAGQLLGFFAEIGVQFPQFPLYRPFPRVECGGHAK